MVSAADASVCGHCGRNPLGFAWKQSILLASNYVGVTLWLLVVASRFLPEKSDWEQNAVFCALLAAAGLSLLYFRRSQKLGKKDLSGLNLSAYSVPPGAEEASWNLTKPPEVHGEWTGLMQTARPRNVFWPFWSIVEKVIPATLILGSICLIFYFARSNHWTFSEWRMHWLKDPATFLCVIAGDIFLFLGLLREFSNRQILRDGEVTIGYLIDAVAPGSVGPIAHEFWTRTGERFQHRAVLLNEVGFSVPGVVPVFYIPENPSRSVSLCSTEWRLRIPDEELAERAEQLRAGR